MKQLTILGGPRDGEVVTYCGPEYLMPVPRPVQFVSAEPARLPDPGGFAIDLYRAKQDQDGRWWYVREAR